MTGRPDYDALAQDINLKDITSCKHNADILRMLRDDVSYHIGNPNNFGITTLYIMHGDDEDADPNVDFIVEEGDDLGWLGYFIGKCEVIEYLHICYLPEGGDEINSFFEGMSQNRSMKELEINSQIVHDSWIISLGSFLENNRNLAHFELVPKLQMIGNESAQNLASAFNRMQHSSLRHLIISSTGISDVGLTDTITALRTQSQLEHLSVHNNNIGRNSCIALANTLSRWSASNNLESLSLDRNAIDDEGLQALVPGLMNCQSLRVLDLGFNQSITAAGLRYLFPLLQSESHSLETLHLSRIAFGDDGALALAEGLTGNKSLKGLWFSPGTSGMSSIGWSAFSRLLCDTSTINNTYLSNHTLTILGCYGQGNEDNIPIDGTPENIRRLLTTNTYRNRHGAALCKILQSHPDLDMEPFFKLNMQFLPRVMSWFDRVEHFRYGVIGTGIESQRSCQSRKLSALYKFVRGMPDLAVIGYWEGQVIEIESKKCRIADERRRLQDEMRRLDDEERRLEYEEKVTLERLGDQPVDELNRNKRIRLK